MWKLKTTANPNYSDIIGSLGALVLTLPTGEAQRIVDSMNTVLTQLQHEIERANKLAVRCDKAEQGLAAITEDWGELNGRVDRLKRDVGRLTDQRQALLEIIKEKL